MGTYLFWCLTAALLIVVKFFRNGPLLFPAIVGFIVAVGVASGLYVQSGEAAKDEAARLKKEAAQKTPHVIREADGCKVYAFKSGDHYHYFTRCAPGETVTTDRTYTECHRVGKVDQCTKKTETIETR